MTARERVARAWHDGSDHAADGVPFGGPLCNCDRVAERLVPMLADAWEDGHDTATDSSPGDVWFSAWTDNPNPYLEDRHVDQ